MKKIKYLFLALSFIFVYSFSFSETVVVSGHFEYPPFMYQVGNSIEGVEVDVLRVIFSELGIKVESKYVGNWARTLSNIEDGTVDISCGYINDERKKFAVFSSNILAEDPMSVFVKTGKEFKFEKWEDLIGKRGGSTLGDSQGAKFDEFKKNNLKIELVSSKINNYKKLDYERIDYIIDGLYTTKIFLNRNGFKEKISPLKKPLLKENIYIMVSKKSKYLKYMPEIEKGLKRMREDGVIDKLIEKHIKIVTNMEFDK